MPQEHTLAVLGSESSPSSGSIELDFPESPRLDILCLEDDEDLFFEIDTPYLSDGTEGFDTPLDTPQFLFLSPESPDDEETPDIPEDVSILDYDGFHLEFQLVQDAMWGAERDEKILSRMMLFLDTLQDYRKPGDSGFSAVDSAAFTQIYPEEQSEMVVTEPLS